METLVKIGEFCKSVALPILLTLILGMFFLSSVPVKAEVPAEYEETTLVVLLGDDGSVNTAKVNEDGSLTYFEIAGEQIDRYVVAISTFITDAGQKYNAWAADMENQRTKVEAVEADPKT